MFSNKYFWPSPVVRQRGDNSEEGGDGFDPTADVKLLQEQGRKEQPDRTRVRDFVNAAIEDPKDTEMILDANYDEELEGDCGKTINDNAVLV